MKFFAQTPATISPNAPLLTPSEPRRIPLGRLLLFVVGSLVALALYFKWRPPLPMLWLKHDEHLGRDSNQVALTFDDSPHPLTTPLLLASLRHANIKATFFCVGENLRLYPELGHRILSEGHAMGNHSFPHHNLTGVARADYPLHVDAGFVAIEAVEKAAGNQSQAHTTKLFRPPGGGLDRDLMDYLYQRDYTLAWWSNNVGDWTCPPAWKIAGDVKANLRPGDILLLHDGGTGTPQALDSIAKAVRERGLEFTFIPEKN